MDTQFVERADGSLAYDDSGGDGELVIMVPGMGPCEASIASSRPSFGKPATAS